MALPIIPQERIAGRMIGTITIHAVGDVRVRVVIIVIGMSRERGSTEPERNGEPQSAMEVTMVVVAVPPSMFVPPVFAVPLSNQLDL